MAFAEAVVRHDRDAVARWRDALVEALGAEATVDAAAVVAAFHVVTRIADATGIPLDPALDQGSVALRREMGIEGLRHD